jgi:putative transposase
LDKQKSKVNFSQSEEFYSKKSRFTDSQIVDSLKRADAGIEARELCRELGIRSDLFCRWPAKYGGRDVSMMAQTKKLEKKHQWSRKIIVGERLKLEIVQYALAKK